MFKSFWNQCPVLRFTFSFFGGLRLILVPRMLMGVNERPFKGGAVPR
jgi:hypothetical protein